MVAYPSLVGATGIVVLHAVTGETLSEPSSIFTGKLIASSAETSPGCPRYLHRASARRPPSDLIDRYLIWIGTAHRMHLLEVDVVIWL